MNLNDPKHPWTRLVAAARTVKDDRDAAAPYGFSTRVAALAFAQEPAAASLLDRFALRAVGVACPPCEHRTVAPRWRIGPGIRPPSARPG